MWAAATACADGLPELSARAAPPPRIPPIPCRWATCVWRPTWSSGSRSGASSNGATFFDVGNVWFLRENAGEYSPDAVFHIRDFYKQLGFNTGIGIRLDIKFAVLRLDWGIQLHNPGNPAGERWIHNFKWKNTALNFGVGYPF